MTISHFLDQLDYTRWANRRTLASMEELSAKGIEIPPRMMDIMSHIIAALHIWYARVTNAPEKALPVWGQLTLADMKERNESICTEWTAFLRSKTDDELATTSYTYTNSLGQSYTNTLLEVLTHFPIHSEHHRGQIAQMVRTAGGTPVNTDYIQFAREEHQR
jgi:uncharacterized damage-inducible protein DinB